MSVLDGVTASPNEYEVVFGCFPRHALDEAAELLPRLFPDGVAAHLAQLDELCARMIHDGTAVGVSLIPLGDFFEWCAGRGLDGEHGDARTLYIAERNPDTYPYEGSLERILDAGELDALVEETYLRLEDQGHDIEELVDQADLAGAELATAIGRMIEDEGLVTVEVPGAGEDGRARRYSFHVSLGDDGEAMVDDLDGNVLHLALHLALQVGGAVTVRTLDQGTCVVRTLSLSDGAWSPVTAVETQRWRSGRDDDVAALGGRLEVRSGRA